MKKIQKQLLLAVAVCALALGTIANTKNPVRLPIAWKGTGVIQFDFSAASPSPTGGYLVPWQLVRKKGTMEHLGLYTSHGGGLVELDGAFNFLGLSGGGYVVAANGDKLFWHEEQVGENPGVITYESGTGRFQHATGQATGVTTPLGSTPEGEAYSASGQGWISY